MGFTLPASTPDLLKRLDEAKAWTPAYDSEDEGIREGTWVAELTGLNLARLDDCLLLYIALELDEPSSV